MNGGVVKAGLRGLMDVANVPVAKGASVVGRMDFIWLWFWFVGGGGVEDGIRVTAEIVIMGVRASFCLFLFLVGECVVSGLLV